MPEASSTPSVFSRLGPFFKSPFGYGSESETSGQNIDTIRLNKTAEGKQNSAGKPTPAEKEGGEKQHGTGRYSGAGKPTMAGKEGGEKQDGAGKQKGASKRTTVNAITGRTNEERAGTQACTYRVY